MGNLLGLAPLIAELKLLLGPYYHTVRQIFVLLFPFYNSNNRLFIVYSIMFILIGFVLYLQNKERAVFNFSGFINFCIPRSIFLHKSAILDYKFYFLNGLIMIVIRSTGLLLLTIFVADAVNLLFRHWIDSVGPLYTVNLQVRVIYSLFIALAIDIGFFVAHFISHKVPLFWEFHKVHHSAKVLTPVTNFRFHPVDLILQSTLQSVAVGGITGVFVYLYGESIDLVTVLNISFIYFVFYLTSNFRHSHLWISYGQYLSHIFISPAQHQIHHGSAPRHIDKNFGLIFALWDWIAGTLYVPKEQEEMSWGLTNNEEEEYMSVLSLYLVPFSKAGRLIKGARIFRFGA